MSELETLKVKHPTEEGDYTIINKSDFDEGKHTLFDTPKEPKAPKPSPDPKKSKEAEGPKTSNRRKSQEDSKEQSNSEEQKPAE